MNFYRLNQRPPLADGENVIMHRSPASCGSLWGALYITSSHIYLLPGPVARFRRQMARKWRRADVASVGRVSAEVQFVWDGAKVKVGITMRTGEVVTFYEDIARARTELFPKLNALFADSK